MLRLLAIDLFLKKKKIEILKTDMTSLTSHSSPAAKPPLNYVGYNAALETMSVHKANLYIFYLLHSNYFKGICCHSMKEFVIES